MALVVQEGDGEEEVNLGQNFESNPVTQEEFGEYVASLHSCNNSTFVLQYEVIQHCAIIQIVYTKLKYNFCVIHIVIGVW